MFWYSARATVKIFDLPLKRLSLHYVDVFDHHLTPFHDTDPGKIWCSNITHIAWGTLTESLCRLFTYFPNLTHIMVGAWNTTTLVGEVLKQYPSVQVLIWLLADFRSDNETFVIEPNEEKDSGFDDYRVVTINGHLFKDWIRGAQGEEDMWDIAERKVKERKEQMGMHLLSRW
ncbi:hypothetical protein BDN72DRAFT_612659 [Pluteus cervinus]|uniref:Uncharacterized protein n=1 Tax=Pluteus cervinus TaxID=181527 RepID=A0ACD3AVV0_9AGAR|nr:hypothetical protein BDN72DRAFT_612659 [Pluteus cervinus]